MTYASIPRAAANEPEAVAAGFESNDDAPNGLTRFDRFITPAMQ
jgi:hypothetical protein